jgi:Na+-driven multidrug efflux pump
MLALWFPLAASLVMMVLEPSTINIGLGRTPDSELALAAYGVAFSLALLIQAPVIMLIDASVALSTSREAFFLVRRFALGLGLAVSGFALVFSLTPLYGLVVEQLMKIPADVAARARTTLQILAFWPLPIALRRAHQGVLIRANRTGVITIATGVRLMTLAMGLFGGLLMLPDGGALVAGVAMDVSVAVEAILITLATRRVLGDRKYGKAKQDEEQVPLTTGALWRFYRPLIATAVMRQAMQPALNTGIAAAAMARASLAAWPVVWGFAILITGPAWSLQQLTTAMVTDQTAHRQVRRFSLGLSSLFGLLLGVVAFTPLYGIVMGGIYNLSTELQDLARPALQLLVLLPLIMGWLAFLRGVLIRSGRTRIVQRAMVLDVAALVVAVVVGVTLLPVSGVVLAAIATLSGNLVELVWLYRRTTRG